MEDKAGVVQRSGILRVPATSMKFISCESTNSQEFVRQGANKPGRRAVPDLSSSKIELKEVQDSFRQP